MTGQQLKNSILQMAVQGKLVPQDPNDEPASVLLERIRNEKEKLIKEGKIKKEKNPSVIFRGADNLPYEKVGNNEPVCIADKVPFEIPDSWEWVRLGSISTYAESKIKINAQNADKDLWELDLEDIEKGGEILRKKTVGECNAKGDKTFFNKGNILYSKLRPYLLKILIATEDGICTPEIVPFSVYGNINSKYIVYYLMSPHIDNYINSITYGVKMPRVGTETMVSLFIPIPPLKEQERIVKKIKEVIPFIDEYSTVEKANENLNKEFPDLLKKSILQQAVQGKLIPQNQNDELASVLLEHIRAEKQALIKAGKIKKDKHESVIYKRDNSHYEMLDGVERCIDDEIPFEIPDNWCWARLKNIVYNRGQTKPSTKFCYIDIGSIDNQYQKLGDEENIISPENAPSRARKIVDIGDIIYSTVRPYLHNMCIIDRNFSSPPIASTGFATMTCYNGLLNKFLFYYLLSPDFDSYANDNENSKGVAYPAINDEKLYKAFVPIPPLSEQHRIIGKIAEIMPFIENLAK